MKHTAPNTGFEAKLKESGELRHGLAYQLRQALPNAVYVAFTGMPIDLVGANTRSVFGNISTFTTSPRRSKMAQRCRSTTRPASLRSRWTRAQ